MSPSVRSFFAFLYIRCHRFANFSGFSRGLLSFLLMDFWDSVELFVVEL